MPTRKRAATKRTLKLDDFLPFQLSTASNAVSNLVARTYHTRFGSSIPEWRVVAVLMETKGLTQQELCDRTIMDKVTVSRAAHALVSRGLVKRSPNAHDGRSHMLMLTGEGRRLVSDVAPAALAMEQLLFEAFTEKEMTLFAGLLNRVRSRAEAFPGEPSES
jgi:DNA-binding MarR family transcriptional regulator